MPEKYIGQILEIVYMDRKGRITQRRIEVKAIRGQIVRAKCLLTGAPRVFRLDSILAWQPVKKGA
ncbi:hypothetical protein [Paenibacillus pini]|uniref:hypothetical protein n=1 Tax=Paenibacillus pini TaxID=669461 RepID=UPI00055D1D01|nr:hypothetical protein [Paenibacillus pini]